jgi:hypothetical protein
MGSRTAADLSTAQGRRPFGWSRKALGCCSQGQEDRPGGGRRRLELCRFLGRLHHKTIHALPGQASEKRQGTKSRAGRGSVSPLRSMGI